MNPFSQIENQNNKILLPSFQNSEQAKKIQEEVESNIESGNITNSAEVFQPVFQSAKEEEKVKFSEDDEKDTLSYLSEAQDETDVREQMFAGLEEYAFNYSSKTSDEEVQAQEENAASKEFDSIESDYGVNTIEDLNAKYNLNIDFDNPESISDEQLNLLQEAYFLEEQEKNLQTLKENMDGYFKTLGDIDKAYDGIKGLVGAELTQENIEQYYEEEKAKNDILTSILQNGGSIPLDKDMKKVLSSLGVGDKGILWQELDRKDITFNEAYQILKGVEYNPELIANVMESQDTYTLVGQEYQNAINFEQFMANATPSQALEYFNSIAKTLNDGTTGEDLFNNYYKEMFENYPDELSFQDFYGLQCKGIEIKDGYLWQELSFPEEYDKETINQIAQSDFLYKEVDEEGIERYYRVASLEDKNRVKSNAYGKDDVYNIVGLMGTDTYEYISRANNEIAKNNLYLDKTKKEYDEEYGEGAFNTILEEYPKMYEEAFGKNPLLEKLTSYEKDMDSYSKNISQALSIGCFMASFIPGVQVASWAVLGAAALDNVIDGVNIDSSGLSDEQKQQQRNQLMLNTLLEGGMMLVGMGINRFAQNSAYKIVGNKIAKGSEFILKHAKGVESLIEYGIDNAASVAWDLGKGIIDGSLINEDGTFNTDAFKQMIVSDLIFNTADLRNGMTLYKSLNGGNAVDIGNGVKFQIDSDTGVVRYIYSDGMVNIGQDGNAIYCKPDGTPVSKVSLDSETKGWYTPDGTKIDLTSSSSLAGIGRANNYVNNRIYSSLLSNLDNVQQDDAASCAAAATMDLVEGKPAMAQALLNKFEIDSDGNCKANFFGEEFEFKLDENTNPLQKVYEMYQALNPDNIEGDFTTMVMGELFPDASDILVKPDSSNIDKLKSYNDDEYSMLAFNSNDNIGNIEANHAYRVVSIDNDGNMKLQDPITLKEIDLSADDYQNKDCQIAGKTYADGGLVDSELAENVVWGKFDINSPEAMAFREQINKNVSNAQNVIIRSGTYAEYIDSNGVRHQIQNVNGMLTEIYNVDKKRYRIEYKEDGHTTTTVDEKVGNKQVTSTLYDNQIVKRLTQKNNGECKIETDFDAQGNPGSCVYQITNKELLNEIDAHLEGGRTFVPYNTDFVPSAYDELYLKGASSLYGGHNQDIYDNIVKEIKNGNGQAILTFKVEKGADINVNASLNGDTIVLRYQYDDNGIIRNYQMELQPNRNGYVTEYNETLYIDGVRQKNSDAKTTVPRRAIDEMESSLTSGLQKGVFYPGTRDGGEVFYFTTIYEGQKIYWMRPIGYETCYPIDEATINSNIKTMLDNLD